MGPDQLQGWQTRPFGDIARGKVENPVRKPPASDLLADPLNWEGSKSKWSDRKEILRAGPGRSHSTRKDDLATDSLQLAIEYHFLDVAYDRCNPERPLLAYLGLHAPHYPYQAEEELFAYYLNRVPVYDDEPADHPFLGNSPFPREPLMTGRDVPRRSVQRATAAYYAMVEGVDRRLGRVLDSIELSGQSLDDWLIIVTSDHGDMMGQHGVWEKQQFFEGSVRVPLLMRWPSGGAESGRRVSENVNLCDLYATFCAAADAEIPEGLDSRNLLPLARGEQWNHPNRTHSFFLQQGFTNVMVKEGDLKYCWYKGMPDVLFDLAKDPDETVNLIDDPAYAQALVGLRAEVKRQGYAED